ncbi:MAG: phosphatase PAP2 family protein [Oscillospiraceae bacterium]|jgi:membrane-associated phospholipid phosphatase
MNTSNKRQKKRDWPKILTFAFFPVYIISWALIQLSLTPRYWIYCRLDDLIPFCEWFVIPYLFWYIFFAGTLIFFLIKSREDFLRCGLMSAAAVTVAILIFCVFPNGIAFRPETLPRDNLLTKALISIVYKLDPPYSVMPSLHCAISLTMAIALNKSHLMDGRRFLKILWWAIAVLICVSTVFVRQHSVLDILGALALTIPCYLLAYKIRWRYIYPEDKLESIPVRSES